MRSYNLTTDVNYSGENNLREALDFGNYQECHSGRQLLRDCLQLENQLYSLSIWHGGG